MKRIIVLILLIVFEAFQLKAQYISNPSFESDTTAMSLTPEGWFHCNYGSTPDIQPGFLNVEKSASHGKTYLGLILLNPVTVDGPKNEGVVTKLLKPLYKDSLYILSIDLADAPNAYMENNTPQKLQISGGNNLCSHTYPLVLTDSIKNIGWKTYNYLIAPVTDSITSLKFEIFGDTKNTNGYILLDNITLENFQFKGIRNICQGQKNILFEIPQLPCFQGFTWSYTGKGLTIDDKTSYLLLNLDESATSGNLNIQFNTCETTVGPVTIPVLIDSMLTETGSISGNDIVCAEHSNNYSIKPVRNAENYNWEFSGEGAKIKGDSTFITVYFSPTGTSGTLTVTPENHCGIGDPSAPLSIEVRSCDLDIPNSFSPNDDGINDIWIIQNLFENTGIVILDRFGRVVYSTDNYLNDWDGTDNKGVKLPTDTYWYILTSKYIQDPVKGFVFLKR